MKYPFGFLGESGGQYNNPYNNPLEGLRDLNVMSDVVPRSTQFLNTFVYREESYTGVRKFINAYRKQQLTALEDDLFNLNTYDVDTCEIDLTANRNFYFEEDFQTFNLHGVPNLILWLGVDFQINYVGKVPNLGSLPASGNLYDLIYVEDHDGLGNPEYYWWNPSTLNWVIDAAGNFIHNGGDVSVAFSYAKSQKDTSNKFYLSLMDTFNSVMPTAKWYPSFQINKYKL